MLKRPFDVVHPSSPLNNLPKFTQHLDGKTRVVMEYTGRYHELILYSLHDAGIFGSAVNPHLIENFCSNIIRKVRSNPADSRKIICYAPDNRVSLRQYSTMDTIHTQLKTSDSQMDSFTKQKVATRINLISLLDMTYSGVNPLLSGSAR